MSKQKSGLNVSGLKFGSRVKVVSGKNSFFAQVREVLSKEKLVDCIAYLGKEVRVITVPFGQVKEVVH